MKTSTIKEAKRLAAIYAANNGSMNRIKKENFESIEVYNEYETDCQKLAVQLNISHLPTMAKWTYINSLFEKLSQATIVPPSPVDQLAEQMLADV